MKYNYSDLELRNIAHPAKDATSEPVALTDETILKRKNYVLNKMNEKGLEALVVYADLEHGGNFEYLVGYLPRFEEALLVLHADGKAYLVLGNENLNKASKSRIEAEAVLCSHFSLPNQPMQNQEPLVDIIARTGIKGKKVGVVGWKNFTSKYEDNSKLFDIPAFVLDVLKQLCGEENLTNEASIFIGEDGARVINNPNEIAHYEFASALAGDCVLDALDSLEVGVNEMDIADKLVRYGQRTSIVTIAAFGPRFIKANMYPTRKQLQLGEPVALTVGYKGGSSSRSFVAVHDASELPENNRDYFEKVVAPYFTAIRAWLENIKVGMKGGEMFELIDSVFPRSQSKWYLNPGHTTSDEEWMSSPIYEGSEEVIQNGSLFQTDIIPSITGYPGTSMESSVALANEELREQIKQEYPELWARFEARREYILKETGIKLSEDVLPMCSSLTYLRPFGLNKDLAVAVKK